MSKPNALLARTQQSAHAKAKARVALLQAIEAATPVAPIAPVAPVSPVAPIAPLAPSALLAPAAGASHQAASHQTASSPPTARPPSPLERECLQLFLANEFAQVVHKVRLSAASSASEVTAKLLLIHGVCLRRLELNDEAYATFRALASRVNELATENQLDVLDGLTACATAAGQPTAASHYGKQAIEARMQVFTTPPLAWADDWREQLASAQVAAQAGLKVLSYSLYGHKPVYTEMLLMNLSAAQVLYPGWQVWVYVDGTVPAQVRVRLQAGGARVIEVSAADQKLPGTMWRFLAVEDPAVEIAAFRDADSYLTPREVACVSAWLAAGTAVHAMRDWFTHSELMLAGMSGVRAAGFRRLREALNYFVARPFTPSHGDQHFLRKHLWPYAQHSVTVHDTVFAPRGSVPVPQAGAPTLAAHIGNRLSRHVRFDVSHLVGEKAVEKVGEQAGEQADQKLGDSLKSVPASVPVSVPALLPTLLPVTLRLLAGTHCLGTYDYVAKGGVVTVELPNVLDDLRKAGQFNVEWVHAAA